VDNKIEILKRYLPENAVQPVYDLILKHQFQLVITRHRKGKLGDFRPPFNGKPARITLNYTLNPYNFLLTFLHELAHYLTWIKYKRRAAPHGDEWKNELRKLQEPFLTTVYFPDDILDHLSSENQRIYASSSSDVMLARTMKNYDKGQKGVLVESLAENAIFRTADGRRFQKLQKRRKNFFCLCLDNQRGYVFNPIAEVYPED